MIKRDNVRNLLSLESYQETYLLHFPSADRVLPDANRVEVQNERPFAVHLESGILHGVIDRLVLVYERNRLIAADVIDFKTDAVSDSEIAAAGGILPAAIGGLSAGGQQVYEASVGKNLHAVAFWRNRVPREFGFGRKLSVIRNCQILAQTKTK